MYVSMLVSMHACPCAFLSHVPSHVSSYVKLSSCIALVRVHAHVFIIKWHVCARRWCGGVSHVHATACAHCRAALWCQPVQAGGGGGGGGGVRASSAMVGRARVLRACAGVMTLKGTWAAGPPASHTCAAPLTMCHVAAAARLPRRCTLGMCC